VSRHAEQVVRVQAPVIDEGPAQLSSQPPKRWQRVLWGTLIFIHSQGSVLAAAAAL
jgi:hypothetical protein